MDAQTLFVSLTLPQAEDLVKSWVREAIQNTAPPEPPKPKYYTRREAAGIFNFSLPTLDKYSDMGLIRRKRVGGRILFAEEDIREALREIPTRHMK